MKMKQDGLAVRFDFNGFVNDSRRGVCAFLWSRTGAIFDPERHFSRETIVGEALRTTDRKTYCFGRAEYGELLDELFGNFNVFLEYVHPREEAIATIRRIIDDGHSFQIVSKARSISEEMLIRWFSHHGLRGFPVVVTKDGDKTPHCKDADIVGDDEYLNLFPLTQQEGRKPLTLLMDSPRTRADLKARGVEQLSPIVLVKTWPEIYHCIQQQASLRKAA